MGLTITSTPVSLPREFVSAQLLRDLGAKAITLITERTRVGLDVHSRSFRPLSSGYAKAKADAGLPPEPDLTVSGRMLNDMTAKVIGPGAVEISFLSRGGTATGKTFIQRSRSVGAADKAYYHSVAGAGKSRVVREFFGLNDQDTFELQQLVEQHVARVLNAG